MNQKRLFQSFAAGVLLFLGIHPAYSQGTAFTYQGQLTTGSSGATGDYDLAFSVSNAPTGGILIGSPVTNYDVSVSNGLFTTAIDFGANVFTGQSAWLSIRVRPNGGSTFTQLLPLQPILPVPYSIFAESTTNLIGTLPASQIAGTLPASAFAGYTNTVALTNSANLFSGTFSGNGGAVTNVNVVNLTGVLSAPQLPPDTAYVDSNQTFTASNTFNGATTFTNLYANSFSGSFFGNGLVGWIVVTGTTEQASIDHGYLLTNFQTVTVTLPTGAHAGDIVRVAGAGNNGWQVAQNTNQSVIGNFTTYGKIWTETPQYENWAALASSSSGDNLVAAGYGSGVYLSTDSGASWTLNDSTPTKCVAVASSSDGTSLAVAVTNGGAIYVTTNSGSTWTPISAYEGSGYNWTSVALSSSGGQLLAANAGVGLYIFSGTTYERGTAYAFDWTCAASSANGSNLIAAASGGDIYISANAGAIWTPLSSPGSGNWKAVASSADGTKLSAAIYGGGIYSSFNSGTTWSQTAAPSANWTSLACSSDGSKLVATAYGQGIYTSANWGTTWLLQSNSVPTATNWTCVASSASGATLVAGIYFGTGGGTYTSEAAAQTATTTGTNGYISGGQGSAVELQYIGNNQFMPVSSVGTIWGN